MCVAEIITYSIRIQINKSIKWSCDDGLDLHHCCTDMRLKAEEEGGALLLAANLECASELSTGKSFNMCCWTA